MPLSMPTNDSATMSDKLMCDYLHENNMTEHYDTLDLKLLCGQYLRAAEVYVHVMSDNCLLFELLVSLLLIGTTCVLGLIGNVLSMLTLHRHGNMHHVTTFLLTALSVSDIGFILPAVVVIMVPSFCEYSQQCSLALRKSLPVFIEQFGWGLVSFAHTCTVYMTVLVAMHRYFFVCRPHECHRLSGLSRARAQAALVPLGSLIFNLPRFMEYKVSVATLREKRGNWTFVESNKMLSSMADNSWFQILYKTILYYAFMYILPLILLCFFSIRLLYSLYKRRRNRVKISGQISQNNTHRRDDNITVVLLIIISVFVLCQTPMLAQRLLLATTKSPDQAHRCPHPYFYLEQVANYFVVLNSCVNFAIYFLFARRFRRTLLNEVLNCPATPAAPESENEQPIRETDLKCSERQREAVNDAGQQAPFLPGMTEDPLAEDGQVQMVEDSNGEQHEALLLQPTAMEHKATSTEDIAD